MLCNMAGDEGRKEAQPNTDLQSCIGDILRFHPAQNVSWGLSLKERIGFKRAAVAVAHKLAVIIHATLKSGELLNRTAGAVA